MTIYSLVLFVHVAAVLVLFAVLAVEALALFHLRRASTLPEIRLWTEPIPKLPLLAVGSLLVILFSGAYLTIRISAFSAAWPNVTLAAFLFIAPIAAISGRRMRAIRRRCVAATAIDSELWAQLQHPVLKISLGIRVAVMLGIVLLMGARPGLWESMGILGTCFVLGFLSPLLVSHPIISSRAANAKVEN